MADSRITQATAFCKFLLAQSNFLSEELDAETDVFEKLGFICCAFTGHRPKKFPWKYDEKDKRCLALKSVLTEGASAL